MSAPVHDFLTRPIKRGDKITMLVNGMPHEYGDTHRELESCRDLL